MMNDFEIGRVVAVDTAQISVVLNHDLSGMSRNTYEGPQEVGQINSYVIIPIGAKRPVAMITRVVLVEEAEIKADRTMVTLPATRRMIKATLIGTIEGKSFKQGISLFPVLDSPVQLPSHADLDAVFGPIEINENNPPNPDAPGFCIPIGESSIMQGRQIRIDPDAFFGKHAAILGSTGSGKSCTIASLLQSIHEQPQVKRTTCIILDTNGEYRSAFQKQNDNGDWGDSDLCSCLYIPSDSTSNNDRIRIPYWFMDSDDFVRLFQASKGVQRPVLLEALRLARNDTKQATPLIILRQLLIREFNKILTQVDSNDKTSKSVKKITLGLVTRINQDDLNDAWEEISKKYEITQNDVLVLSPIYNVG